MNTQIKFSAFVLTLCFQLISTFVSAQDIIDIVDPYEMKVSRSKDADTFYFSQNATTALAAKQKLDTLRTYDVFLEERPTPFGTAYMCNGNEVTKQKYFEYKKFWNASGACKPCLLYTYDDKNKLKYTAFQYEDCLCGSYVAYYQDGTKKVEGQFKKNTTDNWLNLKAKNICSIRDGVWTYYTSDGVIERTETYIDGKLKDSGNATNNSSGTSKYKKAANTESEEENEDKKKGLFQRMKDKNK